MVDMQAAGTQARATDSLPTGLRDLFPVLQQRIHGAALAYLDNAATTQRLKTNVAAPAGTGMPVTRAHGNVVQHRFAALSGGLA